MKLRYLHDTVSLTVHEDRCIGCGMCIAVCPHDVFSIEGRKARIQDKDACMECRACRSNCPVDAIEVEAGTGGVMPVLEEMMSKDKPQ